MVNGEIPVNDVACASDNNYYNVSGVPRGIHLDQLTQYIKAHGSDDYVSLFKVFSSLYILRSSIDSDIISTAKNQSIKVLSL